MTMPYDISLERYVSSIGMLFKVTDVVIGCEWHFSGKIRFSVEKYSFVVIKTTVFHCPWLPYLLDRGMGVGIESSGFGQNYRCFNI